MNSNLKDLSYLVSSNAILKILGVVSIMVYTRYLIKEELALVPFYMVVGKLSMVVFSFGILPTLVRDIPQLLKDKNLALVRSYITTALVIIAPGILAFSVICYLCSSSISLYFFGTKNYIAYLELMSIGFFFSGINSAFSFIYWCLSRYQQESSRIVLVGIIQIVTGVGFVILWGIYGLIASLVLSSFINSVINLHNLRDVIFSSSFKLYPVRKLIIKSMPFYLESYLIFFRAEGDQLFVASLLGPKALAIYFIAKKPYDVLSSFTQSLDKVLTTSLAKFKNEKENFSNRVNNIITLNSYILFPIILLAIGLCPVSILIIAGPGYEDAVIPSMILLLWLLVQVSWKTALGKSIFILKSATGRFKVTVIETFLLLGFMFFLGNLFSITGVVIGRLLATVSAGICAYYFIRKDIAIKIDIKSIVAITTYSAFMCLLLLMAQYIFSNYVFIAFSFIFSILLFLFLINRTISAKYYSVLNSISPYRITDPFSFLINKFKDYKSL